VKDAGKKPSLKISGSSSILVLLNSSSAGTSADFCQQFFLQQFLHKLRLLWSW